MTSNIPDSSCTLSYQHERNQALTAVPISHGKIPISHLQNFQGTLDYSFPKLTLNRRKHFFLMCDPFKYTHGVLGQTSHLHASLKQKHKSPTSDFNPKTQNQITHLFPPESKQRQNLYLKACKYQTSESSSPPVAAGINKEHFRTLRYLASAPA